MLANTQEFRREAVNFEKYGYYCDAPEGTKDYYDYWEQQEKYCIEGMVVAGTWIPGRFYFYLNFFPITKLHKDDIGKLHGRRVLSFPSFWECHYDYAMFKHIAWHGGYFKGVHSPGGKHIICAKARGTGMSYFEAADGVYNYNFIEPSRSYYFAAQEKFLIQDGILNKVEDGLNHINKYSSYWKQNRLKKSTTMQQIASFQNSQGQIMGSMNEIAGVIVNKTDNVRGKRGIKLVFEEGGAFKRLEDALSVSIDTIKAGKTYVGQISVIGTGGEEGESILGLEANFFNPSKFDFLEFNNIFEEGYEATKIGLFIPAYMKEESGMDENGNVDKTKSLAITLAQRKKLEEKGDSKVLDRMMAENPIYPSEAFMRFSVNPFSINLIDRRIRRLETDTVLQGFIKYGRLDYSSSSEAVNGVEFFVMSKEQARPIDYYPHKNTGDLSGCVTIYEPPYITFEGKVPAGMYQIACDPYYKDDAEDRTSLWVTYVLKQPNQFNNNNYNTIVASYIGRPNKLNSAIETTFMLSNYYNCTVQAELGGGGRALIDYAKNRKIMNKIEFEPELHKGKENTFTRNRSLLMNITGEVKKQGFQYFVDYHTDIRGENEDKTPILNLDKIYDVGLLQEMKKYNDKGNFDRISAMIVAMFMLKENVYKQTSKVVREDPFFKRTMTSWY